MSQEALLLLGVILNAGASGITMKVVLAWHRADINRAQERADEAHKRIDGLLQQH